MIFKRVIAMTPQIANNRIVMAAMAGTLVWFADQPTVDGYNPLFEMFWDPGLWRTTWRSAVWLACSSFW